MSKASNTPTVDPADAYDAFRLAYGITMQAWRKVSGKPGHTSAKQRQRKADILLAFDGTYMRDADFASDKARRKAARKAITSTAAVEKIARKARKHETTESVQEALPGMGKGKGKGRAGKAPAKRPAGAHIYAMGGIRKALPGEPANGSHPLYVPACEWVTEQRAENPGQAMTTDRVAYAIASGDIAAPRKASRKGRGKRAGK